MMMVLDQRAGGGVDLGAVVAYPGHIVAHPLDDVHGLEQPLAGRLGEHVIPAGEAEDDVALEVHLVLHQRRVRLDVHLLLAARGQDEVVGQVLAADEPAGLVVPEVAEQDLDLLVAVEDALGLVLERGVLREAGQHLLLVAGVQAPGVVGEQLLDFQAVLDGDLRAHRGHVPFWRLWLWRLAALPADGGWVTRLTNRASCAPSARSSTPTEPICEMWLCPSDQITGGTVPFRANQAAVSPATWVWLNSGSRSATAKISGISVPRRPGSAETSADGLSPK